jgi:hypothetical protein
VAALVVLCGLYRAWGGKPVLPVFPFSAGSDALSGNNPERGDFNADAPDTDMTDNGAADGNGAGADAGNGWKPGKSYSAKPFFDMDSFISRDN